MPKTRLGPARAAGLIGVFAALVAGPTARAQSDPIQATIPFIYEEARVYVPAASARGPLGLFILDTGAEDSVIDRSAARRAGVHIVGEDELRGAGRGSLGVGESDAVTLVLGAMPLRLASAHVGALDALLTPFGGPHVGGLIGGQLFREHVVAVDFGARELRLFDPKRFVYRGAGVRLPLRFAQGAPIVDGVLILADGSRLKLRLLVDLGAPANLLLAEPFAAAHPALKTTLSPSIIEPLGAGVGGETAYAFARLPRLEVGALAADNPIVGTSVNGALGGGYYDGLLGARFLQRYRVIFDYPRREIIFEPNPLAEPDRFDRCGAFLIQDLRDLHRFTVHAVAPGSPAAEAGLRPGDVVRTFDALPASAWTLAEIRDALTRERAAPIAITVERAGRTIAISMRPRPLL